MVKWKLIISFLNISSVKEDKKYHLNIEIDKLTNSILNTITGDSFETEVIPVTKEDLKNVTKKNGWLFLGHQKVS